MLKDLAQPSHLLILAVIIVVLFGWKKLPDAARSVGRSMRIFKSEMSEMKSDGKESKPSPAATDTVAGVVPTPPTTPQPQPQTTPEPQTQAPQASHNGSARRDTPVDAPFGQPQSAEPARHDTSAR